MANKSNQEIARLIKTGQIGYCSPSVAKNFNMQVALAFKRKGIRKPIIKSIVK
jgi:hypothetical protein